MLQPRAMYPCDVYILHNRCYQGVCNDFTSGNNFILKAWVDYTILIFLVIILLPNYQFKYSNIIIAHWTSCEDSISEYSNHLRNCFAHLVL